MKRRSIYIYICTRVKFANNTRIPYLLGGVGVQPLSSVQQVRCILPADDMERTMQNLERLSQPNDAKKAPIARVFSIHNGFGEPIKQDKQRKQLLQLRARGLPPTSTEGEADKARHLPVGSDEKSHRSCGHQRPTTPRSKKNPRPRPTSAAAATPAQQQHCSPTSAHFSLVAQQSMMPVASTLEGPIGAEEAASSCAQPDALDAQFGETLQLQLPAAAPEQLVGCQSPRHYLSAEDTPRRDAELPAAAPEQLVGCQSPRLYLSAEDNPRRDAERRRHQVQVAKRAEAARRAKAESDDAKLAEALQRAARERQLTMAQATHRLSVWAARRSKGLTVSWA